jgi:hypothetical protein
LHAVPASQTRALDAVSPKIQLFSSTTCLTSFRLLGLETL